MKKWAKIIMLCLSMTLVTSVRPADAAEAILPIKARIIRCVTPQERRNMCSQENLCCGLLDTEEVAVLQSQKQTDDAPSHSNKDERQSARDAGNKNDFNSSSDNVRLAQNTRNNFALEAARVADENGLSVHFSGQGSNV